MAVPRSEAAKQFNFDAISRALREKLGATQPETELNIEVSQSPIADSISQIAKHVAKGETAQAQSVVADLIMDLMLRSSEDNTTPLEALRDVLLETIEQFVEQPHEIEAPVAVEQEAQSPAVEVIDLEKLNTHFGFFIKTGRSRVGENFLKLRGADIDVFKENLTREEEEKISQDFFYFLKIQIDIILDSIALSDAKDDREAAFVIADAGKLRLQGAWDPSSHQFVKNFDRTQNLVTNPLTLDDWYDELPKALKPLFAEVREVVQASVSVSNQSKEVISFFSSGKAKISDEEVIKFLGEKNRQITYGPQRLLQVLTQSSVETSVVNGQQVEGRLKKQYDALLGDLTQEAFHIFDRSFRGIKVTIPGTNEVVSVDLGFPNEKAKTISMYMQVEKILVSLVRKKLVEDPALQNKVDEFFSGDEDKFIAFYVKEAIQQAYDLAWSHIHALSYDKNAFKSSFGEGANASTYHQRDRDGIPDKTPYKTTQTSKSKTPRVTDKATYYFSPMEFIHSNILISKDDVHIGDTPQSMKEYFEDYFFERYGGNSIEEKKKKRNSSKEFLDAIGQIPSFTYIDDNGNVDYQSISRDFITIQVKNDKTAFNTGADRILVRRSAYLNSQLADPNRHHISVLLSLYDAIVRAKLPQFDEKFGVPMLSRNKLPSGGNVGENYLAYLGYEYKYFMKAALTNTLEPIKGPLADQVQWHVDPTIVQSLKRMNLAFLETTSKLNMGASKILLSALSGLLLGGRDGRHSVFLYEEAVKKVLIQQTDVPEKINIDIVGLKYLNDNLFDYYPAALSAGEDTSEPIPVYDREGNIINIKYKEKPETFRPPALFDKMFRNTAVSWREVPYYASTRIHAAKKRIDALYKQYRNLEDIGATTDTQKEQMKRLKIEAEKMRAIIFADQLFFTLIGMQISKFMFVLEKEDSQFKPETSQAIVENMQKESTLRETITSGAIVHMPEDVAVETSLYSHYMYERLESLLTKMLTSKVGLSEMEASQITKDFMKNPKVPGLAKANDNIDTWGYTQEEIQSVILSMYAANEISSGVKAAGVALDWLSLAAKGKIKRFTKTKELLDKLRETRATGGIFSALGLADFYPQGGDSKK